MLLPLPYLPSFERPLADLTFFILVFNDRIFGKTSMRNMFASGLRSEYSILTHRLLEANLHSLFHRSSVLQFRRLTAYFEMCLSARRRIGSTVLRFKLYSIACPSMWLVASPPNPRPL